MSHKDDSIKILDNFIEEKVKKEETEANFNEFVSSLGLSEEDSKMILEDLKDNGIITLVFSTETDHYYRVGDNSDYIFRIERGTKKITLQKTGQEHSKPVKKVEKLEMTEEEINSLAKEALETAKNGKSPEDIIKVFETLCLPFDKGKGLKEQMFLKIFKLAELKAEYVNEVGVIVPATEEKQIVVVSHMDLIPSFNKGFNRKKKYELGKDSKGNDIISGALDNTMTNAVAMIAAIHNKNPHVEFVFTEGEETGFWGMKAYMREFHKKELFYINMDVTNDAWENHVSIEYDEPNFNICKQVASAMNAGFTTDRVCDDLDVVVDKNGYGFSYCLPTNKTIHSWKNYTIIDKLVPYLEGLNWFLKELDSSEKECDIEHLSIKKALKCESYEVFKKKEKNAKKKKEKARKKWASSSLKNTSHYSRSELGIVQTYSSGQRYFDFSGELYSEEDLQGFGEMPPETYEYEDLEDYEDMVGQVDIMNLEYVVKDCTEMLEHMGISVDKYLAGFIHEHTFAQDQWSIDELAGHIGDLNKAQEVILILDDNLLLITIEPGSIFKFPVRSEYSA